MSIPRDWDAAVREARGEPIRFVLGGTEFSVPTPVPAAPFLTFTERDHQGTSLVAAFRDLLLDIVEEKQRKQLERAIRTSGISSQMIVDLAEWVVEESTARPTVRLSTSPASPSESGEPTNDAPELSADRALLTATSG